MPRIRVFVTYDFETPISKEAVEALFQDVLARGIGTPDLPKPQKIEVKEVVSKAMRYQCLICSEIFDTSKGKGKMHMASEHGLSLKGAIQRGKVLPLKG